MEKNNISIASGNSLSVLGKIADQACKAFKHCLRAVNVFYRSHRREKNKNIHSYFF